MAITSNEAARALEEIRDADRRTRVAGAYAKSSPHFLLWGAVWTLGYIGSGLTRVEHWGWVWMPLVLIGVVGAALIGSGTRGSEPGQRFTLLQSLLMGVGITAFLMSVYWLFRPAEPEAFLVFPALVAALVYVIIGAIALPRFAWIGVILFAASMGGYVLAKPYLAFWIAAAGGGGLILAGLWLRRV